MDIQVPMYSKGLKPYDPPSHRERYKYSLEGILEYMKCSRCHKESEHVYTWKNGKYLTSKCRECNTKDKHKYFGTKGGKKIALEASRKAYEKHKEKWLARAKVRYAVKTGRIVKPEKCEVCGKRYKRIEGHHPDYSKPLEVIWLCTGCHADVHSSPSLPT